MKAQARGGGGGRRKVIARLCVVQRGRRRPVLFFFTASLSFFLFSMSVGLEPLRPLATRRSNAKAPLSSCQAGARVGPVIFQSGLAPAAAPCVRSTLPPFSPTPPIPLLSKQHVPDIFPHCFHLSLSPPSHWLRCLQLPSPTAMSTALRGISCYLREVRVQPVHSSFCLSGPISRPSAMFNALQ